MSETDWDGIWNGKPLLLVVRSSAVHDAVAYILKACLHAAEQQAWAPERGRKQYFTAKLRDTGAGTFGTRAGQWRAKGDKDSSSKS